MHILFTGLNCLIEAIENKIVHGPESNPLPIAFHLTTLSTRPPVHMGVKRSRHRTIKSIQSFRECCMNVHTILYEFFCLNRFLECSINLFV